MAKLLSKEIGGTIAATPSAPVVKDASVRVYRNMKSLVDQESMNLYRATKQLG